MYVQYSTIAIHDVKLWLYCIGDRLSHHGAAFASIDEPHWTWTSLIISSVHLSYNLYFST
jgi:hypothetical protein